MSRTSTDTEIEQIRQIIDEVGSAGNDFWHKGSLDFWMGEVEPLLATLTTEAYEQGKREALDAIGDDEPPKHSWHDKSCGWHNYLIDDDCTCGVKARNEFRTEIRASLTKTAGEGDSNGNN